MLCALARSSALFATLIFTQLIDGIFKIGRTMLEKPRPRGGSYFFYIRRRRPGGEVEKAYLPTYRPLSESG
jgi:hypothetical protein